MDLNLVVLAGRLAVEPEIREFESGARLARFLMTVTTEDPRRRVDVVPVTLWEPSPADLGATAGERFWVSGMVQRRFWSAGDGRRSQLQVITTSVRRQADCMSD